MENEARFNSIQRDELLRLFVDNVRDYALFLMDIEGRVVLWSPAAERVFGYSEQEAVDRYADFIFTEEDIADGAPEREMATALEVGRAPDKRWHRRKDGSRFWAEGVLVALKDRENRGFGKVVRDATLEEGLRFAVQSADIGTWHWDFINETLTWSEQCKAIFGVSPDVEVTYDMLLELIHPDDKERVDNAVVRTINSGGVYNIEYRAVWPDKSVHWVYAKGRCMYGASGQALRFEGIAQDITDRKRSEEKVRRLLGQVHSRAKREGLINRIGQAIRANPDPRDIQSAAAAALVEALAVDRCYFVTLDVANGIATIDQEWYRTGMESRAGEYQLSQFNIDVNHLFRDGRTIAIDDIDQAGFDSTFTNALKEAGMRSGVSVPLFDGGVLTAALTVAMAEEPRLWTSDEVALVEAVATQIRSAVEAARVVQREHAVAVQLQEALMPAVPESVPGLDLATYFQPALEEASVGGDFVDVFDLDDGCVALVLGDVSGKGLAAAAQVATVRNTMRYSLYRSSTTAEAVTDLNRTLTRHNLMTGFVTLFVGVFDPATRILNVVSCGHEPALVMRKLSGSVEELLPTGPILGLDVESVFDQRSITMSAGDVVLVYTDGLSDAGVTRSEALGIAGLVRLMRDCADTSSAKLISRCIIDGAKSFARNGFHDDVCLLTAVAK